MTALQALTKAPSTTVTWAALAGFGTTGFWGLVETFSPIEPSSMLVGGTVSLAAGVVGKLVKEKRYKMSART